MGILLRISRRIICSYRGEWRGIENDNETHKPLICGNKMPTWCNRGFYCRSYCLLNMFRAPLCPSSGAQEYYTVVAACGISCCGFQVAGLVWSWGLCVRFVGCCSILQYAYAGDRWAFLFLFWLFRDTLTCTVLDSNSGATDTAKYRLLWRLLHYDVSKCR